MSDVKLVEMRDNRKVLSKLKNSAGNQILFFKNSRVNSFGKSVL